MEQKIPEELEELIFNTLTEERTISYQTGYDRGHLDGSTKGFIEGMKAAFLKCLKMGIITKNTYDELMNKDGMKTLK